MNNIKILFEDKYLIVLDKPAGILVHPTPAKEKNTLVDFLKKHIFRPQPHRVGEAKGLDWLDKTRPGIVHRLDKDTSGLIIIAKTPKTLKQLQAQFKKRKVKKVYTALVLGELLEKNGKIETAIARGKTGIQKAQILNFPAPNQTIRSAITFYTTIGKYLFQNNILTLLKVSPKTGRMHQIRVHLKFIGYPIVGDQLYNTKLSRKISKELDLTRQFLHAQSLTFQHPYKKEVLEFKSDLPKDLKDILAKLEKV